MKVESAGPDLHDDEIQFGDDESVQSWDDGEINKRIAIIVDVYGKKFKSLVDSGSGYNIMSLKAYKQIGISNLKVMKPHFDLVAGNNSVMDVKFRVFLPVAFGNKLHITDFLVADGLNWSVILGMQFLRTFKVKINFPDMSMTIGKAQIPVKICEVNVVDQSNVVDDVLGHDEDDDIEYVGLTSDEKQLLNMFIADNEKKFSNVSGRCNSYEAQIRIKENSPIINKKQFNLPPPMLEIMRKELQLMLQKGQIEESTSEYNNPVFLVPKDAQRTRFRVISDSRELNKISIPEHFQSESIDSLISSLRGSLWYTKLDLESAFFQVPLKKEHRKYTSFSVPGVGCYQYTVCPQGHVSSMSQFCRALNKVLSPLLGRIVVQYSDDLLVFSKNPSLESHLEDVQSVLDLLRKHNLKVNVKKCRFAKKKISFLGYVISGNDIRCSPNKIKSIAEMPIPKDIKTLQQFIATCNFFRKLVPGFSIIASPLYRLLKKNVKFQIGEAEMDSFMRLKSALISDPIIQMPNYQKPFFLWTDACDYGVSAILLQDLGDEENDFRVISYASRSLNIHECAYTIFEKETLAVIYGLDKFKDYILGSKFPVSVVTDNKCVSFLQNCKNPRGRVLRWLINLNSHNLTFQFRSGKLNFMSDLLSRTVENQIRDAKIVNPFKPKIIENCVLDSIRDFTKTNDQKYINLRDQVKNNNDAFPLFSVDNNNLLKKKIRNHLGQLIEVFYVPEDFREELVKQEHQQNHFGFFKNYKALRINYFFPKMADFIANFVRCCQSCGQQKIPRNKRFGEIDPQYRTIKPMSMIYCDYIGPLISSSPSAFRYVFICVCAHSRYVITYPARKATAEVTKKFLSDLFYRFGACDILFSDCASIFRSHCFEEFLEQAKVHHMFSSPHSPQSNRAERSIADLKCCIRTFLADNQKKWEGLLQKATFELNQSVCSSTGFSPHELLFGTKLRRPGDILRDSDTADKDKYTPDLAHSKLIKDLSVIRKKAEEECLKSRQRYAKNYNAKCTPMQFMPGELVYKRNYFLSNKAKDFSAGLAPKFSGPWKILKVLANNMYLVSNLLGTVEHTVNVHQLKPFHE